MTVRVWDAVLINDELDLLELRLQLLDDLVDHFVVVEADRTFRGQPKALHVTQNLARFAPWASKLELVVANLAEDPEPAQGVTLPKNPGPLDHALAREAGQAWAREHEQERAQLKPLAAAAADDVVLLGDVDEIPKPHAIRWLTRETRQPVRLTMRQAVYRANWESPETWYDGTLAIRAGLVDTHPLARVMTGLQATMDDYREDELRDAGWHFTSLGTPDDVRRKLTGYSHVAEAVSELASVEHLTAAQRLRSHHLGTGSLRTLSADQLDELQLLLLALRPDLFDFSPPPPSWRRNAHSAAAGLNRRGRLSGRLRSQWLAGELPLLPALGLAGFERLRVARRRRRPDPWAWKRGATLELDDQA